MDRKYVLAINPGSTSTKIAIYQGEKCVLSHSLSHDSEEIKKYDRIYDQKNMRTDMILKWLEENNIKLEEIQGVVGRGGLLRPMPGGTYKVTEAMLEDLKLGYQGQHASNLGGIIAEEIGKKAGVNSFIVDPVAVDEVEEVARISGLPEIPRRSLVHALNVKAVTRRVCKKLNKSFSDSSFVVAHIGGGITVSPIKNGRILDCNNANEEGPFSPERAAGLPVGDVVKLIFSNKYDAKQFKKKIIGEGGLVGYLGTNDARKVEKMIEAGDKKALLVFKAFAYQIAKEIAAMATVLNGKLDGIILTGGVAYDKKIVDWISEMVGFIAPVQVVPGEDEMLALAQGALRVINGEEKAKIYEKEVQIK
ncbi:butyrate kinase [Clostridium sp. KNHs214]|uniref:butyrate kinase n=1 Tax=Clostridium sp. KNHs214 TaxID=1540257 RepID=UPI00054DCF5A|nr:butyrate kinase [Clostridium sp. KNHs214]